MKDPRKAYELQVAGVVLVALMLLGAQNMPSPDVPELPPCEESAGSVKVVVTKASAAPPAYSYAVTNVSRAPVTTFLLGTGSREEMQITPENIPNAVESPKGWEGQAVFGEESEYMTVFWRARDADAAIAASRFTTGFKVRMPAPSAKKTTSYSPSGLPIVPLDMKKAPFRVLLQDGTCVWGRAEEQPKRKR